MSKYHQKWMPRKGQRVWYRPLNVDGAPEFQGTVAREPWEMGQGTIVTHLVDLDANYQIQYGLKNRVPGVWVGAIRPVEDGE